MPQFQPTTGTLICVSAKIYLTSVLRMRLENNDSRTVDYLVDYVRNDSFAGPGISPSITGSRSKTYGPYHLAPDDGISFNTGGADNVAIGPDTVYNKVLYQTTTANVVNYLGSGTVSFAYKSTVNTYAIGSDYYSLAVNSQNKVDFTLTYSYCNNILLKLSLQNFQAILKDRENVLLSWITPLENENNSYEIELSENGSSFRPVGTTAAQSVNGAPAKYDYQYHLDQPAGGKLYFRIKQINGKGAAYSDVRIVSLGTDAFPGVRIYPNPVVQNINMEFDRPLTGQYKIELSNQMGQIVYSSSVRLNNSTAFQVQLNNRPPAGIYFLRTHEVATGKVYSGKLLFTK